MLAQAGDRAVQARPRDEQRSGTLVEHPPVVEHVGGREPRVVEQAPSMNSLRGCSPTAPQQRLDVIDHPF